MGANGNVRLNEPLPRGTIVISAGELKSEGGFSRTSIYGSVDGATLFHMELITLGPRDAVQFVESVARVLRQRQSRIVAPA